MRKKTIKYGVVAFIGFLLSPLSWWNDLFINIPLAYVFSWPFSLLSESLFLPLFVVGYWLTNVLGLVLLHKSVAGMTEKTYTGYWEDILLAVLYTAVIVVLVLAGVIPPPTALIKS